MMRRIGCFLAAMLMMISAVRLSRAEETGYGILTLANLPTAGDREIRLEIREGFSAKEANVFSDGEAIAKGADLNGRVLTLSLTRKLKAGETLTVLAEVTPEQAEPCRLEVTVASIFSSKLATLCTRADEAWGIWADQWYGLFAEGKVYLPVLWKEIPFALWPDEAPEIAVKEADGKTWIYLQNEDMTGWRICLGNGIPIEYTECAYDASADAWTGEGAYEAVCLIRDATENAPGITIEYRKENGFLPSCPVLEWQGEIDGKAVGMNCYGWGTGRSFDGGMYAIGTEDSVFYAEYDMQGVMTEYQNALTECAYDRADQLITGEEPEGYVNPVFH